MDEFKQLMTSITPMHLISLIGIAVLARWLLRTSLGRKALVDAPPRRNSMAPYTPFIPFFVWLVGIKLMQSLVDQLAGTVKGWQGAFLDQLIFCIGALATVAIMLVMAKFSFARGWRGFGLRLKAIPKDLGLAFVDLLAVWPLVLAMIVATTAIGKVISGQDFEMPQHQGLELITTSPAVPLQILIVFLAVVVAPLLEEMLFRGLFQTVIRSYLQQPWLAVIIASLIFATVHENVTHWPALFVLALGLGYAYEKSGSLFRPIFMHALFNGVTIAAALFEPPAWM